MDYIPKLILTSRKASDIRFLESLILIGKPAPHKYKHFLILPLGLFFELWSAGLVDVEFYYIEELAFFEFAAEKMTIRFRNLCNCEDMHRKIDRYLIIKLSGSYPVIRGGTIIHPEDPK